MENITENSTRQESSIKKNQATSLSTDNASSSSSSSHAPLFPVLNEVKGYFELGRCIEGDPELAFHNFSITVVFVKGLGKVSVVP